MRIAPALLLLTLCTLAEGGCARKPGSRIISDIPQSVAQEVFLVARTGMQEQAAASGLQIDWNGPGATDQQRQIDLIQQATRERRYGLVVTPAGGSAIDTALQNALRAGMPVVLLRDATGLREQPHLSFVLEDYKASARLVTDRLRKRYGCRGTVVITGVDNFAESSVRRLDALEEEMRTECPLVKIADPVIAPFGSGFVQVAAQQALAKYPDLICFVALNARAGLGVESVVEGMRSHASVISYDPSLPLLIRMRRGFVDAVVAQDMRGMGRTAVQNIVADRQGKPYPHSVSRPAMLITRDNIDDPRTQDWLQFEVGSSW